jgi:ABC-type lipoprotein release transport system permease subunit
MHGGDPVAVATIVAVLAGTAAFACWLPSRRATKVDPIVALRGD